MPSKSFCIKCWSQRDDNEKLCSICNGELVLEREVEKWCSSCEEFNKGRCCIECGKEMIQPPSMESDLIGDREGDENKQKEHTEPSVELNTTSENVENHDAQNAQQNSNLSNKKSGSTDTKEEHEHVKRPEEDISDNEDDGVESDESTSAQTDNVLPNSKSNKKKRKKKRKNKKDKKKKKTSDTNVDSGSTAKKDACEHAEEDEENKLDDVGSSSKFEVESLTKSDKDIAFQSTSSDQSQKSDSKKDENKEKMSGQSQQAAEIKRDEEKTSDQSQQSARDHEEGDNENNCKRIDSCPKREFGSSVLGKNDNDAGFQLSFPSSSQSQQVNAGNEDEEKGNQQTTSDDPKKRNEEKKSLQLQQSVSKEDNERKRSVQSQQAAQVKGDEEKTSNQQNIPGDAKKKNEESYSGTKATQSYANAVSSGSGSSNKGLRSTNVPDKPTERKGYRHTYDISNHGNTDFVEDIPFMKYKDIDDVIILRFYACIISTWKGRVVVYGDGALGDWKVAAFEMQRNGSFKLQNGAEIDFLFGEHCISRKDLEKAIGYKYLVFDKVQGKLNYEELYTAQSQDFMNRMLFVPDYQRKYEVFNQVDDIILPSKKLIETTNKQTSYIKGLIDYFFRRDNRIEISGIDANMYTQIFIQRCYVHFQPENAVGSIEERMLYLRDVYLGFFEAKSIKKRKEFKLNKLNEKDLEILWYYVYKELKKITTGGYPTPLDGLLAALQFILLIDKLLNTKMGNEDNLLLFTESLSIEKIKFEDVSLIEILEENFTDTSREEMLQCLFNIWEKAVKKDGIIKSGDVKWCNPLVLMHKLSEKTMNNKLKVPNELKTNEKLNSNLCGLYGVTLSSKKYHDMLDTTFQNIECLQMSLTVDKMLQRSLAFLMLPRHYISAFKSNLFRKRLLVQVVIDSLKSFRLDLKDEKAVDFLSNSIKSIVDIKEFKERCLMVDTMTDLLTLVLRRHNYIHTFELFQNVLAVTTNLFGFLEQTGKKENEAFDSLNNKLKTKFDNLKDSVESFCRLWSIGSCYSERVYYKLMVLGPLYDVKIFTEKTKCWQKTIWNIAEKNLEYLCTYHSKEFIEMSFRKDYKLFACWEKVFEKYIDVFLKDEMFSKAWSRQAGGSIIGKRILKEWMEAKTFYHHLEFVFEYLPMKVVLKQCWGRKEHSNEDLNTVLDGVNDCIFKFIESIMNSTATLHSMQILKRYRNDFHDILEIIEDNKGTIEKVKSASDERLREAGQYNEVKAAMVYFKDFLKDIPDAILNMQMLKIKLQTNEQELKLKDVYNSDGGIWSYFEITEEIYHKYIKFFFDLKLTQFTIFQSQWNVELKKKGGKSTSFMGIIEDVFVSTTEIVRGILNSIADGSMSIPTVVKYSNLFHQDVKMMQEELKGLFHAFEIDSINKHMSKIECVVQMSRCVTKTKSILVARDQLKLSGDFSTIEMTHEKVSFEDDNATMNDISKQMMEDVKKLSLVDNVMDQIFKAVSENVAILIWLRENLNGPNEVKVFVEMMSIAAGESDYEVDRVACFEATCTAFASIIFELKEDSNFADFESACRKTKVFLEADEKILEKLLDSNRNIEWFRKAKQSQGSVSTKSLFEAKQANKNGTFTIGNLSMERLLNDRVTLNNVIKLAIPYEDNKSELKILNLNDIHDLQSRLMLLGRDSNEEDLDEKSFERDFFVKQAEWITNLGTAFVSLVEAGYTNILTWKYEWKSDVHKAKEDGFKRFFNDLEERTNKFGKELKGWQEQVTNFRNKYHAANIFTMKQCLLLQKYLFECSKLPGNKLPTQNDEAFSLLQFVSDTVTREKVKQCLISIHAYFEANIENSQQETNFSRFSLNEIEDFCNRMEEDFSLPEEIVLASLMEADIGKEGKAIIWCQKMLQNDDEVEIERLAAEAVSELDKMKENSLEQDREEESFETEDVFLPLDDLGKFLQEFADERKIRSVPDYLNKDKPSLVLVEKDDILLSLLAMYENDGKGSLPERDEVLLCSSNVSVEQIELLILRAVHNNGGLYCLAFADELDYKTTERVLDFLMKCFSIGKMNPFVIMCNDASKHQSLLISALETYRVNFHHSQQNVDSVGKILQKSLCMSDKIKKDKNILYGAHVDMECSNARCVTSKRGGMGKSLYVEKIGRKLENYIKSNCNADIKSKLGAYTLAVTVPVHGTTVSIDQLVSNLIKHGASSKAIPRIYHFDVAPTVYEGLDELMFNVVILGSLQTATGRVWKKEETDLCFIEFTDLSKPNENTKFHMSIIMKMIPRIECATPTETSVSENKTGRANIHHDIKELETTVFQRVTQYINVFKTNRNQLDRFNFDGNTLISSNTALQILISYCGIKDPSWMEITNFVHFFNQQLIGCEHSVYTSDFLRQDFPGFKSFVITFLLEMTRDFSTRSLGDGDKVNPNDMVVLKRTWEQSSHPYLFFNSDRSSMDSSMTFFGINVTKDLHLVDQDTQTIITQNVMRPELYNMLLRQLECDFVNLQTNYSNMERKNKITILCRVLGIQEDNYDPDPTYELTLDNMKKMLAIHMRSRCGIPVVLMGETGCGKTTLINFMSKLRAGPDNAERKKRNMLLVKVHGGTTMANIEKRIREAQKIAEENKDNNILVTTLFLDEANTSDAIGLIKEIMVDKKIYGEPLGLAKSGLEVIAACNPYRQHSKEMIDKLESAGLGYHVGAIKTYEKMGEIPLRQLVYRVHPLPESMKPLVWDFGQLNAETEEVYTQQIIRQYESDGQLPRIPNFINLLVKVLAHSQQYMRRRKDECSFVSLRDVKRAVQVTSWFYKKMKMFMPLIKDFDDQIGISTRDGVSRNHQSIEEMRRSLILALSVCYIARLEERDDYIESISKMFTGEFSLRGGANQIKEEIKRFQEMVMSELKLEDNIAKNQALCENVFMMVICIELRIPLFVVGKPGSSKSLAKTIVQDNMQGNMSKSEMFKKFKQVFMSSYQCSPLSTAEGIISVFRQSSRFQEGKNLEEYTSVVVLDEVGLAEDSPRMPLKVLHPLLEDGTDGSEDLAIGDSVSKDKRVAVIGISNWALDPAKMNRGIMLRRCPPTQEELKNTARDICASDKQMQGIIVPLLEMLAGGYSKLYERQKSLDILKQFNKEEFFGLRDFYSLVKMIFCHSRKKRGIPSVHVIEDSVKRNFSGLDGIDSWSIFAPEILTTNSESTMEPNSTTVEMIKQSFDKECPCSSVTKNRKRCTSNRYLLVMTEKYSALPIIEKMALDEKENMTVIFGSSFPKDQEFTQVCRDINRIKMCMETGKTVILLNMENLYESLYDALNQYYVYLGGKRYVDLGLGTHRVKCRVHEDFKLIVIADKDMVYERFPIPLINRLEKHYLVRATSMSKEERQAADALSKWVEDFAVQVVQDQRKFSVEDSFIGFNKDACAAVVIEVMSKHNAMDAVQILEEGKRILLKIATPEAIARLPKDKYQEYAKIYYREQKHSSLTDFLYGCLRENRYLKFIQVTTYSRLLTEDEIEGVSPVGYRLHRLQLVQFETEHSFREAFTNLYKKCGEKSIIAIQYSLNNRSGDLVPCAQHICKEIAMDINDVAACVMFILQTRRGFNGSVNYQPSWECIHLDELRQSQCPTLVHAEGPISRLFEQGKEWMHVIVNSIQGAIEKVNKDLSMTAEVITRKIDVLVKLLQKIEFSDVLLKLVYEKIREDEKKKEDFFPEKINRWVANEAKELKFTPGYGTFREALVQCVEEKVVTVLANLIIQMDTNDNLLVLENQKYEEMWIQLFQSLSGDSENGDAAIKFCLPSKFPFSHKIMQVVDNLNRDFGISTYIDDFQERFEHLLKAFSDLPIYNVINGISKEELVDYCNDIILYYYGLADEKAIEILTKYVFNEMEKFQELLGLESEAVQACIPAITCVINLFKESLDNVVSILNIKPAIVEKIKVHSEENDFVLFALLELLNCYLPQDEDLEIIMTSKEIRATVERVFSQTEFQNTKILRQCKTVWMKLTTVRIYLEDVIYTSKPYLLNDKSFAKEALVKLWNEINILDNPMESLESWVCIENFIKITVASYDEEYMVKDLKNTANYDVFKENLLQFFISFVLEFCFSRKKKEFNRIDQRVIRKILGYAFSESNKTTKQFSPLENFAVDKTPVIRLFIVQQLLNKDEIKVDEHLNRYLEKNFELVGHDHNDHWNICKIYVYCYEDHLTSEANLIKGNTDVNLQYLNHISNALSNARSYFINTSTTKIDIDFLKNVAMMRMSISISLDFIYQKTLGNDKIDKQYENVFKEISANLMKIITHCRNSDIHMFTLRSIISNYGNKGLHNLITETGYNWLQFEESNKSQMPEQDNFLVYGEQYKNLREEISKFCFVKGNDDSQLKEVSSEIREQPYICEFALLHYTLFPEMDLGEFTGHITEILKTRFHEKFMQLEEQFEGNRSLLELICHIAIVADYSQSGAAMLLKELLKSPSTVKGCFLPTMPSDNFHQTSLTGGVAHQCPNGHPYVITECGRPAQQYNCPECGVPIGGTNHTLIANNERITQRDNTKTGHCIGRAGKRPTEVYPERNLNQLSTILQRFLLHLSMLLGSVQEQRHRDEIAGIFNPPINGDGVIGILEEHIQHDFFLMKRLFGKQNDDDLRLLAHLLLKYLLENRSQGNHNANSLRSKQGRDNFEDWFHTTIIAVFIQNYENDLKKCKKMQVEDTRIGENPLQRRLYELDLDDKIDIKALNPLKCFHMWSYRQPINIQHFKLVLQEKNLANEGNAKCQLSSFLEQDDVLCYLKDLPEFIKFQEILFQQYAFRIDKRTAKEVTLKDELIKLPIEKSRKITNIVCNLSNAWRNLIYLLKNYGRIRIGEEFQLQKLDLKTPLAYFLSTRTNHGSCFMALVDFLAFNQNEFLSQYEKLPGSNVETVSMLNLKKKDVIDYVPERDLLPLLYTNCDYSLEIGKAAKVEYNIERIQKSFIDRVCFGKVKINIQMKEFVYRDDVHNARKFTNLGRLVHQESISLQDQRKIVNELTEIADLSYTLDAVEIAIGFLSSTVTASDPDKPYVKYLEDILRIDTDKYLKSRHMKYTVRLKHLTSVWLALTVEKAVRYTNQGQQSFEEAIVEKCSHKLNEDQIQKSKIYLKHVEVMEVITCLTEYIVCGDLASLSDSSFTYGLKDAYEDYEDQQEKKKKAIWPKRLPSFLKLHHLYSFWQVVAQEYQNMNNEYE